MYQWQLIRKYLFKRRIAWVSLLAVGLCTAMVIIVISVMGGWIRMFKESFKGMSGDVVVLGDSITGFAYYDQMIDRMEQLPQVEAAVPLIRTFGLINIRNVKPAGVQVYGMQLEKMNRVAGFGDAWNQYNRYIEQADDKSLPLSDEDRQKLRNQAEERGAKASFSLTEPPELYRALINARRGDPAQWPGMIAGAGLMEIGRDSSGKTVGRGPGTYHNWAKLTVLAINPGNASIDLNSKAERNYWIVDDSRTKVWQYDSNSVYVDFTGLQRDLGMDAHRESDEPGAPLLPARTTEIHVKAKPGVELDLLRDEVQKVVSEVLASNPDSRSFPPYVMTWLETQKTFIGAVEKEKSLVTFLFAMISVVAIFLIFCIFYMIVVEKTKDIGIIKSVGATRAGVAGIFLGYGLAIGIVGGGVGLAAGWLIVRYINELHAWMGRAMGVQIWNPEVYAFDTIPNTINPREVAVIVLVAVVSSVLGAVVPFVPPARILWRHFALSSP